MSTVIYMLLLKMLIYIIKCLVEHVKVTPDSHVCCLSTRSVLFHHFKNISYIFLSYEHF